MGAFGVALVESRGAEALPRVLLCGSRRPRLPRHPGLPRSSGAAGDGCIRGLRTGSWPSGGRRPRPLDAGERADTDLNLLAGSSTSRRDVVNANCSRRCPAVVGCHRLSVGNAHVSCRWKGRFRWSRACRRWTVNPSRKLRRFESFTCHHVLKGPLTCGNAGRGPFVWSGCDRVKPTVYGRSGHQRRTPRTRIGDRRHLAGRVVATLPDALRRDFDDHHAQDQLAVGANPAAFHL